MEFLVKEVEGEIIAWLSAGVVMLAPDTSADLSLPRTPISSTDAVLEISWTPLQLVWSVEDNAFTRYILHYCAHCRDVVSFSKDTSGQCLTYLLRPNVTCLTLYAAPMLDIRPVTDLSGLSGSDLDIEFELVSDRDLSNAEGPNPEALAMNVLAARD